MAAAVAQIQSLALKLLYGTGVVIKLKQNNVDKNLLTTKVVSWKKGDLILSKLDTQTHAYTHTYTEPIQMLYLNPIRIIIKKKNSRTCHFLSFNHGFQISQ